MGHLEVSPKSWHWKVYMLGVAMWAKFLHNWLGKYERPNLCSYIRTIFVYLPIMLALNLTIYTSPFWVVGSIYHYYGPDIFMETIAWFSWIRWVVLAIFGIMLALFFINDVFDEYSKARREQGKEGSESEEEPPREQSPPSFTKLLLHYMQDRHDMVCRQIVIKDIQTHTPGGSE